MEMNLSQAAAIRCQGCYLLGKRTQDWQQQTALQSHDSSSVHHQATPGKRQPRHKTMLTLGVMDMQNLFRVISS